MTAAKPSDGRRIVGVAFNMPDGNLMSVEWGCRHSDAIGRLRADGCTQKQIALAEQGFVDENGRFLTRREAFDVAALSGQLKRKPGGYDGPELFSEDLW